MNVYQLLKGECKMNNVNLIKRLVGGVFIVLVIILSVTNVFAYTTTSMATFLKNSSGAIPAAGTIKFIAYVNDPSGDEKVFTELSPVGYNGAAGLISVNISNLAEKSSLPAGQPYTVQIAYPSNGEWAKANGVCTLSTDYANTSPGAGSIITNRLPLLTANYVSIPQNVIAYKGNGSIVLKWDAPATGTPTGYRVYRRPSATESVAEMIYDRRGTPATLYFEDSATNGAMAAYIVCAYNASGYGPHTDEIVTTADATGAPTITPPLSPTSGNVGSSVTITGSGFGATKGTGFVLFNGVVAATTAWSNTSITATVPTGATTGPVCVINSSSRASNLVTFTVTVPGTPIINSCSPARYAGDSNVTMTVVGSSTNFVNGTTVASVSPATGVTINSTTVTSATQATINVSIAAGAAAGGRNITMTTGGETATGTGMFVITAPSIASVTPATGAQGANLTGVIIVGTGTHFTGTPTVTFSGTNITVSNVIVTDVTHLTCNVAIAAAATTGARNVTVTTGGETATRTGGFTVTSGLPTVTGVAPATGPSPNTGITITGTNFTNGVVTAVLIGSTPITVYSVSSATSITGVSIPAGLAAGAYDIRVTNASGQSAINAPADRYTVTSSGGGGGKIYEGAGGIMMAYPNPFNPNDKANPLKMLFNVTTGEAVDIYIFDTNGRVIYQDRDSQTNADRTVTWNGETSFGEVVENGLYLIRVVKDGKLVAKGKILVIKK
jgi:hypothetical protein